MKVGDKRVSNENRDREGNNRQALVDALHSESGNKRQAAQMFGALPTNSTLFINSGVATLT